MEADEEHLDATEPGAPVGRVRMPPDELEDGGSVESRRWTFRAVLVAAVLLLAMAAVLVLILQNVYRPAPA